MYIYKDIIKRAIDATTRQLLPCGRGWGWVLLLSLLPFMGVRAQDFTQFDWNVLRIDSMLPTYSEVVPLEGDARLREYSVRVLYPEWAPLTKAEQEVAAREQDRLADSLQIDAFVGFSRGQAMLDISFIPVIYRDGQYLKLLSGKVMITGTKDSPPPPLLQRGEKGYGTKTGRNIRKAREDKPRWASNSVLATGQWVRITVTDDGLYRLPFSTLRSMGFTKPENIRVYGYGGHRQREKLDADTDWDDLEPVALQPMDDGFVFHANGLVTWRNGVHVTNHYARAASYFVTADSTAAAAIEKVDMQSDELTFIPASNFKAYAVHDPDEYALFQGGNQLFENYDYAQGNTRTYTLTLPTYTARYHTATFFVNFTASSDESTFVTPTVNGVDLPSFEVQSLSDYSYAMEKTRRYTGIDEPQQSTIVRFKTTSGHNARLNYFELTYQGDMRISASIPVIQFSRALESDAEEFRIRYDEGQQPRLWQLAAPGAPAKELVGYTTTINDQPCYCVPVVDDGIEHRYVAFDANALSSLPVPTSAGAVANQNLHAVDSLDMVIITPASGIFDNEANRLAEAHRQIDGLRVGVFRADQIYNEFSSGTPDATAYRRFLKMMYDRTEDKAYGPRYLLLFGDGAWDNRMLTTAWRNYSPDNFLLCYESDNSINDVLCYVMEDYYGLLDDGEGSVVTREKVDVGVGRFPVRSVTEARALVDKTIAYMQSENAGAWRNVVVFLGDDGDNNNHLKNTEEVSVVVEQKHPELEVRKVIWDAYQRQISSTGNRYPDVERIVERQIEEGALMLNYTGHAAPYCLSHEQVLRIEDFAAMTSPRTPLWVTAACDVQPFDSQKDNIGETAILNTKAGIVAFFGTTRTVYADKNRDLNRLFCDEIFDADELGRPNYIGDAVRLSKSRLASSEGTYTPHNKLHFVLLGDPVLRFGSHGNRVVLDSINGYAVNALPDDFILHAGGKARFSGHLVDAEGESFTTFDGTINAHLYDSERTVTCLNNDRTATTPFTFKTYDKILYNGTDSVRSGRFTITCPIPLDISYSNAAGRLLFHALSNDKKTEANGYNQDFLLGGTEPGISDTEGPLIAAYLGNDKFEDGGTVSAQPFFVAQLEDESGINTAGTAVGHDLELIVDGNPSMTYNLNDYFTGEFGNYQRGTVAFTIPKLEEGAHSLLFRAWDTLGNPSTSTLNFVVDPSLRPNLMALTTSDNPATTQTTFLLTYDRPGTTCDFTIEVFDYAGRLLWNHSESGSSERGIYAIPWNLTTGSGFPLGSGVYLYRARISCEGSSEATKAQKLIINRRQ